MQTELAAKYEALKEVLENMGSVAVSFSGGTDSTLLAKVAHDVLGDDMCAVTASLRAVPKRELEVARAWCSREGIEHVIVDYDELTIEGYAENPPERCYLCKRTVFSILCEQARLRGFACVVDGSNVDDLGDYRPGMRALSELGVRSPLTEAGLTKDEVRAISKELDLPTWDMPSAACLASRFAYGEKITAEKLRRVEAAEDLLHDMGFRQCRVRVHGQEGIIARIEVEAAELSRLTEPTLRDTVVRGFKDLGFVYVCADLTGFRSGAMNEAL